ncbi:MAG: hypothetical protein GX573_23725, partial [Chloroflexi bacterium]|nr:hypothetical protein [Chloroflexota bacterium]
AGQAYVYLGSATGLAASPAWTAKGDQAYAYFGFAVGTAGDVNGDGYSDVVVGAHGYDGDQMAKGRAHLYLGSATGLAASPAWTVEGGNAFDGLGYSAGAAGDVNGDGYSDVIVGAPGAGTGGRAYVYPGAPYYCAYLPMVTRQQGSPG